MLTPKFNFLSHPYPTVTSLFNINVLETAGFSPRIVNTFGAMTLKERDIE